MSQRTMNDPQREDWSRHYDAIHWNAMTFFATGAAALLGYVLGKPATEPVDLWIGLFGLWTTNMTVYFTAGYREFRRELLLGISNEATARFLTDAAKSRRFGMWRVYVATFFFLDMLWVRFFWRISPIGSALAAGVCLVFLFIAHKQGRSVTFDEWLEAHPKPTAS